MALFAVVDIKAAAPAQADPSRYWTILGWEVEDMKYGASPRVASRYRDMIGQLRRISGHDIGNGLMRTTSNTQRYIELRVIDRRETPDHRLSLYLRADNLYLDGYTAEGRNYMFSDAPAYLTTRFRNQYPTGNALFQRLPYSSQYGSLANDTVRGAQSFNGPSLRQVITDMSRTTPNNWWNVRTQTAAVIGATAEAARFGWIENRIGNSLGLGGDQDGPNWYTHLGAFGTGLQNAWAAMSRLVYRDQNGTGNVTPVVINGRTYSTIQQIVYGTTGGPAIAPLLTLSSAT
ncbi:ribosome-inactivating family protein [Streptomyces sp. NPDC018019]|uniref:ribosome-inactivating family protein n=1 Tax=Streptomyces sp. NPDC018019 TaxID=3365030 RepID=UPI0037B83BFD